MVHMIPKPEFTSEADIEAYYQGYANGVMAFAYWEDGKQYVGSCKHPLQEQLNELLTEKAAEYDKLRARQGT